MYLFLIYDERFLTIFTVYFPPRTFICQVDLHVLLDNHLCTLEVWTLHHFEEAF